MQRAEENAACAMLACKEKKKNKKRVAKTLTRGSFSLAIASFNCFNSFSARVRRGGSRRVRWDTRQVHNEKRVSVG